MQRIYSFYNTYDVTIKENLFCCFQWLLLIFLLATTIQLCIASSLPDDVIQPPLADVVSNKTHHEDLQTLNVSSKVSPNNESKDVVIPKPLKKPQQGTLPSSKNLYRPDALEGTSSRGSVYYLMPDDVIDDMQRDFRREHHDEEEPQQNYRESGDFHMEDFPVEPLPGLTCIEEGSQGNNERSEDYLIMKKVLSCKRVKDKQHIPSILFGDLKGYTGQRKRSWVKCDIMKVSQCTIVTDYRPTRNPYSAYKGGNGGDFKDNKGSHDSEYDDSQDSARSRYQDGYRYQAPERNILARYPDSKRLGQRTYPGRHSFKVRRNRHRGRPHAHPTDYPGIRNQRNYQEYSNPSRLRKESVSHGIHSQGQNHQGSYANSGRNVLPGYIEEGQFNQGKYPNYLSPEGRRGKGGGRFIDRRLRNQGEQGKRPEYFKPNRQGIKAHFDHQIRDQGHHVEYPYSNEKRDHGERVGGEYKDPVRKKKLFGVEYADGSRNRQAYTQIPSKTSHVYPNHEGYGKVSRNPEDRYERHQGLHHNARGEYGAQQGLEHGKYGERDSKERERHGTGYKQGVDQVSYEVKKGAYDPRNAPQKNEDGGYVQESDFRDNDDQSKNDLGYDRPFEDVGNAKGYTQERASEGHHAEGRREGGTEGYVGNDGRYNPDMKGYEGQGVVGIQQGNQHRAEGGYRPEGQLLKEGNDYKGYHGEQTKEDYVRKEGHDPEKQVHKQGYPKRPGIHNGEPVIESVPYEHQGSGKSRETIRQGHRSLHDDNEKYDSIQYPEEAGLAKDRDYDKKEERTQHLEGHKEPHDRHNQGKHVGNLDLEEQYPDREPNTENAPREYVPRDNFGAGSQQSGQGYPRIRKDDGGYPNIPDNPNDDHRLYKGTKIHRNDDRDVGYGRQALPRDPFFRARYPVIDDKPHDDAGFYSIEGRPQNSRDYSGVNGPESGLLLRKYEGGGPLNQEGYPNSLKKPYPKNRPLKMEPQKNQVRSRESIFPEEYQGGFAEGDYPLRLETSYLRAREPFPESIKRPEEGHHQVPTSVKIHFSPNPENHSGQNTYNPSFRQEERGSTRNTIVKPEDPLRFLPQDGIYRKDNLKDQRYPLPAQNGVAKRKERPYSQLLNTIPAQSQNSKSKHKINHSKFEIDKFHPIAPYFNIQVPEVPPVPEFPISVQPNADFLENLRTLQNNIADLNSANRFSKFALRPESSIKPQQVTLQGGYEILDG